MAIGTGSVALMVAIGFVVLGLTGLPIAKWFLLGAIVAGVGFAFLFYRAEKKSLFPDRFF